MISKRSIYKKYGFSPPSEAGVQSAAAASSSLIEISSPEPSLTPDDMKEKVDSKKSGAKGGVIMYEPEAQAIIANIFSGS